MEENILARFWKLERVDLSAKHGIRIIRMQWKSNQMTTSMATIIAEIRMVMKKGPGATLSVTSDGIIVILTSARKGRFYNLNDLDAFLF